MLYYSLLIGDLRRSRSFAAMRMFMDRIRRKKLRLVVLGIAFFIIYILMYKAEAETRSRIKSSLESIGNAQEAASAEDDSVDQNVKSARSDQLFHYTSPNYPGLRGKPFAFSAARMRELRLLSEQYVQLTDHVLEQLVFATAASFSFFDMVKEVIYLVQKHRPQNQIYVYDLGMSKMQAHEIQSMCGVNYRKFGFSIFPKHVSKKHLYAWKPLIVADVLTRHPGILWMDSSVRLTSGDFSALFKQVKEAGGVLSLTTTGHSTYAATNPRMLKYLPPGDPTALKREEQREATILLYRTKSVMNQVVKWLVLCALDVHCIAPTRAQLGCVWRGNDHFAEYGNCHRYDQSAFNLLMLNYVRGASSSTYYASDRVCTIERFTTGSRIPKYCGGDKSKEDLEIDVE